MTDTNSTYFAARPTRQCVEELETRTEQFYEWLRATGQLGLWRRMVNEYYAGAFSAGTVGTAGEQDEYTTIKENQIHSLGEHVVVMVTGSRPNFEPKAKNSDHESATQTILGAALLDQAHREKDLEGVAIDCVRWAGQFSESFGFVGWDPNAGKPFAQNPDTGAIERTGDLVYEALLPLDVVRDVTKIRARDHQWAILRREKNKFDLIAQFPELASKILAAPSAWEQAKKDNRLRLPADSVRSFNSDAVVVWEFYHDRSPACPDGRFVQYLDADTVLADQPLQYPWLPIVRMAPEEMPGSQRGYTSFFDLLPLQHVVSAVRSLILSHVNNYGTGVWWTKQGANLSVKDLAAGFRLVKGGTEPPAALAPPQIPDYLPEVALQGVQAMEALSGVNSVRRGTVTDERSIQPQAAALLDAKAIEYSYGLQRGYVRFLEAMATRTIQLYQAFAKMPQVALIVGKANQSYLKEFTGSSIAAIDRVTVDIGNPVTRTTSGRLQLAQMLLGMPESPIKTPAELEQVLSTGKLEPAIEATRAELLNIRAENEVFSDGGSVPPCAYDNHIAHIREHLTVIASPAARENPAVMQAVLQHCDAHVQLWRTTDPAVLMSLGVPPPPPPPMQIGPAPGAPVPPGANGPPKALPPGAPPHHGDLPHLPQMPQNPATGEQAPSPIPPA